MYDYWCPGVLSRQRCNNLAKAAVPFAATTFTTSRMRGTFIIKFLAHPLHGLRYSNLTNSYISLNLQKKTPSNTTTKNPPRASPGITTPWASKPSTSRTGLSTSSSFTTWTPGLMTGSLFHTNPRNLSNFLILRRTNLTSATQATPSTKDYLLIIFSPANGTQTTSTSSFDATTIPYWTTGRYHSKPTQISNQQEFFAFHGAPWLLHLH